MAKWVDIGSESDFPEGDKQCIDAQGIPAVICNVKGQLLATINVCPHAGLPLGEGDLAGKVLTCPFHGYTYNIETGMNIDMPDDLPLTRFATRITDGRVEVQVPIKEESE